LSVIQSGTSPSNFNSADRVNATARFIIYATCIVYLIRRDPRIFVLGATALGVLYIMEKSNMVKDGIRTRKLSWNGYGPVSRRFGPKNHFFKQSNTKIHNTKTILHKRRRQKHITIISSSSSRIAFWVLALVIFLFSCFLLYFY
jgi:hypothetical protein